MVGAPRRVGRDSLLLIDGADADQVAVAVSDHEGAAEHVVVELSTTLTPLTCHARCSQRQSSRSTARTRCRCREGTALPDISRYPELPVFLALSSLALERVSDTEACAVLPAASGNGRRHLFGVMTASQLEPKLVLESWRLPITSRPR